MYLSYDADKDGFLTLDDFLRLVHTVLPASSARAGAAAPLRARLLPDAEPVAV